MAIKFQYNKTSLGELDKQLKMRVKALPTIKSKESALRAEVKKARDVADARGDELTKLAKSVEYMAALWAEFDPALVRVRQVRQGEQKIAGVEIPLLEGVDFEQPEWVLFGAPIWWVDGMELAQKLITLRLEHQFLERKTELLDRARKKTTQKVNLYEKVQIPDYQDAIRRIKRFMEDEENLSKSSQKIVKARQKMTFAECHPEPPTGGVEPTTSREACANAVCTNAQGAKEEGNQIASASEHTENMQL